MSGKIRVSFVLALFIGALLTLALFLGQSDTLRADVPQEVSPQAETATEDTPETITLTATHVDGIASPTCEELTFTIKSGPSNGTLSGITNNACTPGTLDVDDDTDTAEVDYTPNAEFFGNDTFTYDVAHGPQPSGDVTVNIAVAADDDAPVAADQTVSTPTDTLVVVTLNATDIDDCELTFTATSATNGALSGLTTPSSNCTQNGADTDTTPNSDSATVTFTPNAGFQGTGSFTFSAADGTTTTDTTVTVNIGSTPVADAQSVSTVVNTSVLITLTGSDADGCDSFGYTIPAIADLPGGFGTLSTTTPAVTCSGGGDLSAPVTFFPFLDIQGSSAFTFTIDDGSTGGLNISNVATVDLTVSPPPPPVVAGTAVVLAGQKVVVVTDSAFTKDSTCLATLQDYPGNIANVRYCGLGENSNAPLTAPNFYIVLTEGPAVNTTVAYQISNP